MLDSFGLLQPHTILAHSNYIDINDLTLIANRQAVIAHCPLSNIYFADAVLPLRAVLDSGAHVGLGTDISGLLVPVDLILFFLYVYIVSI